MYHISYIIYCIIYIICSILPYCSTLYYIILHYIMLYDIISCYIMLVQIIYIYHVVLNNMMLCYIILCFVCIYIYTYIYTPLFLECFRSLCSWSQRRLVNLHTSIGRHGVAKLILQRRHLLGWCIQIGRNRLLKISAAIKTIKGAIALGIPTFLIVLDSSVADSVVYKNLETPPALERHPFLAGVEQ